MACNYMIWDREAGHTGNLKGSLQYCGADSDSSGLCPEHAAFVADAKCPEVSKLDMKHWYRVPAKRKAKLAPPNVRETIIEPGHYAKQYALYEAAEGKDTYGVWFGKAILPVRAEPSAEDIAEQERQRIEAHAELMAEQAAFLKRRADAEAKEVKRRAAEWKDAQAKMPDTSRPALEPIAEPTAETVCGFRFEYRAEGGSGFYWNGKRVASTRQGLERIGPAVLARICK